MTLQDFENHYNRIARQESNILMSCKALYDKGDRDMSHYPERMLVSYRDDVILEKGELTQDDIRKLHEVQYDDGSLIGFTLEVSGTTRQIGRYDYFDKAIFQSVGYRVKESLSERDINYEMKQFLNMELAPKGKYLNIDCKLMKLFLDQKITMDEVVRLSMEDCSL